MLYPVSKEERLLEFTHMMKTQHDQAQILHICLLASFIQTLLENLKNKQLDRPFLKMVTNKSNNKFIFKYLKYTQEGEHS